MNSRSNANMLHSNIARKLPILILYPAGFILLLAKHYVLASCILVAAVIINSIIYLQPCLFSFIMIYASIMFLPLRLERIVPFIVLSFAGLLPMVINYKPFKDIYREKMQVDERLRMLKEADVIYILHGKARSKLQDMRNNARKQ